MRIKTTLAILLFSISLFVFSQKENVIQKKLDSICKKSGYPGIVFSHVGPKGKVKTYASGWANKEAGIAMTPQHKLHGGSTGKTIVSAVLMQLVIENKIKLDDKAEKYLSTYEWYPRLANSREITIRNLMNHSSGIVRYEFKDAFLKDLANQPDKNWKPEELIKYVLDDEAPFKTGTGFTYSDTNYILLGMIIEKITGKSFYEVADQRILKPGKYTSFTPTNRKLIPGMAQGYYKEGSEYALGFKSPFLKEGKAQNNMQFEWTGGGYVYETADYARLLKALYEGNVFKLKKVEEDYFQFIEAKEIGGQYGLGIIKYQLPAGESIGHSGFFPGYNTAGFYHLATKQVFAMQINSTQKEHMQRFFPDYLILMKAILEQ